MSKKETVATNNKVSSEKKTSKTEVKKSDKVKAKTIKKTPETKAKADVKTEVKEKAKTKREFKKPEMDLDTKKILMSFLGIFFVLIAMFVAWDVRSGPISLDGLDKNVEASLYNNIKNIITQQVNSEYPNLNQVYKEEKVNKEFQNVIQSGQLELNGQTIIIDDLIKQQVEDVKSQFKAENGQTYLTAIDPYHFLGLGRNYLENGHTGTTLDENGNPYIEYKLAPIGVPTSKDPDFHTWLETKLMKKKGLDENSTIGELISSVFIISAIIATLSAIPAFLIIRKFSNDYFALFGSLTLVTIGTFVSRTVAGFVDTDAYNVFFPLMIIAFLVYGMTSKNKITSIALTTISGFFLGMFIWAWSNGWFMFLFTSSALLGYLIFQIITNLINKDKIKEIIKNSKTNLITLITFLISSTVFTSLLTKTNIFKSTYTGLIGGIGGITTFSGGNIWPNVLSSVAELNAAGFNQIVSSVGGKIIFLIALVGLTYLVSDFKSKNNTYSLLKRINIIFSIIWTLLIINGGLFVSLTANKPLIFLIVLFLPVGAGLILSLLNNNQSNKIFAGILLSIWIAGTIYMSLNGVRFILLLAPAFAIAFGIGMYYLSQTINVFLQKEMNIKSDIGKKVGGMFLTGALFLVLFMPMFNQAQAIGNGVTPNFDDAWYASMEKIRTNSSENAIITSWWDFGHFFATVAQRGVTFDGATQTTPRSHWVGRLLMENDEAKAQDILRMLTCGGNEAHNTMLSYTEGEPKDAVKVNKILDKTFGKDSKETRDVLANNEYYVFDETQLDSIMNYLSCENPGEDFLITSQDMIGKAGVWAHWGSWDFTKKYVHDNYKTLSAEQIAIDIDENDITVQKYIDELKEIDTKSKIENIKRENLINQWFADYPSYIPIQGQYTVPCGIDEQAILTCQHGLKINMSTTDLEVIEGFEGQVKFKNIVLPTSLGNVMSIEQQEDGDVDVVLIPNGANGFNALLAQHPLGASTFTKLFYLNGYGSTYFDLFDNRNAVTGNTIKVWNVLWEPKENEILMDKLSELEVQDIKAEIENSGAQTPINQTISQDE